MVTAQAKRRHPRAHLLPAVLGVECISGVFDVALAAKVGKVPAMVEIVAFGRDVGQDGVEVDDLGCQLELFEQGEEASEIVGARVEGFCGEVLHVDEGLVDFEEEGGDFARIGEVLRGE